MPHATAEADPWLGRVIGQSVMEVRFRARYGQPLYVGDILVAEDDDNGERYLLRVTNIAYGAEAAGPDWMERTAGTMLRLGDEGTGLAAHRGVDAAAWEEVFGDFHEVLDRGL